MSFIENSDSLIKLITLQWFRSTRIADDTIRIIFLLINATIQNFWPLTNFFTFCADLSLLATGSTTGHSFFLTTVKRYTLLSDAPLIKEVMKRKKEWKKKEAAPEGNQKPTTSRSQGVHSNPMLQSLQWLLKFIHLPSDGQNRIRKLRCDPMTSPEKRNKKMAKKLRPFCRRGCGNSVGEASRNRVPQGDTDELMWVQFRVAS